MQYQNKSSLQSNESPPLWAPKILVFIEVMLVFFRQMLFLSVFIVSLTKKADPRKSRR